MTLARTVGGVGWPTVVPPLPGLMLMAMPTKAMTARNTPTSRTSRLERFKLGLPESCDRWQHCSTGERRRDYTNGLGPLGGFGRKPCTLQGGSQGARGDAAVIRTTPDHPKRKARPGCGRAFRSWTTDQP